MIQIINISLIPSENKPVINVSQFDNVSRVLRFNVFDDLGMETPHVFDDGDTVLLNIRKNDNNIVVITGVIVSDIDPETQEVTGQYLTFELTEQACACVGSNFGELSITSGDDEVIGSCNFKLIVERSPLSGGVSSQTAIDNLTTQIEQITEEVIGDNYYDKEEIDGKFDDLDIPTKTSELENDSGFITSADIPTIPTKTSQLTNDSGFITAADIPTIPTKTSQLTNDSGFTTIDDAATVNDKTWSSNKINNELINLLPTATASGSVANFNTSFALPYENIVCDVNATGGGGTPAEPNPVGGVSIVNLTQADENMQAVDMQTINLNNTYYGGYFSQDKNGNRLFVGKYSELDMGDLNYIAYVYGGVQGFYALSQFVDIPKNSGQLLCSIYKRASSDSAFNGDGLDYEAFIPTATLLKIKNSNYTDANDFKTAMQGVILYYELAEPFTVELPDGEPLTALVGTNNVYCDTGNTTVTYKCSINEAINAAIASQSNRTLSLMRSSETFETLESIERGDNNDDNAR